MTNSIFFVTSNNGKIASAKKHITKIGISPFNMSLIEPRSENLEEIAEVKARQAHDVLEKPCLVLDAGFFVEALNGFPRAYPKFMLNTLGVEGLLKLLENVENRRAVFKECLAYYDYEGIHYFWGESPGTISTEIRGGDQPDQWSKLWSIFIPDNCEKTLAEMTEFERANRQDHRTSPFVEFNNQLTNDPSFIQRIRRRNRM